MKKINFWINSLMLVLFPADPEEEVEEEKEEVTPVRNFIVLILLIITIGLAIVSAS